MDAYGDNVRSLMVRNEKLAGKFYQKGLQLVVNDEIKIDCLKTDLNDLKLNFPKRHSSNIAAWFVITLCLFSFKIELFQNFLIYIFDLFYLKFIAISLINFLNQILCFDTPEIIIY